MNEEILNKKIKMEMKMAHTFLKESRELFSIYDDLFKQDFEKEISFKARKPTVQDEPDIQLPEDVTKEIKELEERQDRDPELYTIYKKIAMKTHPDRTGDEELINIFNKATEAINQNDWIILLEIASELKIKIPKLTKELRQKIQNNVVETNKKIKKLHNTTAWVWANAGEEHKEQIRLQVRQLMGIDEEAFQEHLKST
tara:strand:+ start:831 stop:1427 length:597 start_codon:yes stop_codon:yes gene_type:complete